MLLSNMISAENRTSSLQKLRKFGMRYAQTCVDVAWRLLEIHLTKVICFSIIFLATQEVSALARAILSNTSLLPGVCLESGGCSLCHCHYYLSELLGHWQKSRLHLDVRCYPDQNALSTQLWFPCSHRGVLQREVLFLPYSSHIRMRLEHCTECLSQSNGEL